MNRILDLFLVNCWAMEAGAHRRMMDVLVRHASGVRLTEEELTAATGKVERSRAVEMSVANGVASIPIHGVIAHRASAVGRISSRVGTSVEHIRADLQAALDDDAVQAIVLDVDSPGGSVQGLAELGDEIRAARAKKPIVAHTDGLMASAAYWLASQADKVVATKSATVGSIGVIASVIDQHRALANEGLDPVVVKSTPGKGGVQSTGAIGDADRADLQREVDAHHAMFVDAVAAGRGIDRAQAEQMADGRVYLGEESKARGLIDAIGPGNAAVRFAKALARARVEASAAQNPASADVGPVVAVSTSRDSNHTEQPEQPEPMTTQNDPQPAPASHAPQASVAMQEERARAAAITSSALPEQSALVAQLVADGVPVAEALAKLNADLRQRLASAPVQPLSAGNAAKEPAAEAPAARIAAMPEGKDKWAAEFAASKDLQAEFGTADRLIAYQQFMHFGL